MATAKGHMDQIRKNNKSTKNPDKTPTEEKPMETLETCSYHVFTDIINPQQLIATDLTGRYLVT